MSGKRYYGYQGYSGYRRSSGPSDGLFGWTVFMFLLIGFVLFCWMGSYYIFAHPEIATNYNLLKRLHKLEDPQRFEITAAPRGEFLKPGQLLERFASMTSGELRRTNETLLRSFIRNYHQNRDLVPYAVGTYRVLGTLPLSGKTFAEPGLVALLQAVEQPEVLLEQLFTADDRNLPALQHALTPGQEIKLEKPLDLSAVVHVDRLPDNRIRLTTMPLLYGTYGASQGQPSFSLEPPATLNIEAGLPVLTADQMTQLTGGKIGKSADGKKGGHIARIREEMPTPTPDPQPRVAKALPAEHAANTAQSAGQPAVARAIPVNAPAVLPAIPVNTPPQVAAAPAPAAVVPPSFPAANPLPVASPALPTTPLPAPVPASTVPHARPVAVAAPATPSAPPSSAPAVPATTFPATNAVGIPVPGTSEVWPVYSPGQMPRGRLVDASEGSSLASRGIGGERHYLEGRFAVTAAGNGRAVLRPQGALAGVPMGPSSKVRVIVEFPGGSQLPSEGSTISRDNLRPFQITSVKRGDDGQINIYAREITRGQ